MASAQSFVEIPEFNHSEFTGGVLSRNILERLRLLVDLMNEQANQMDEWREQIIKRLLVPLLDQTVDPNGE
jgi:E3 ubiquitin-protein ligase SHPRH